ncbi:MAG: hypothetical protein U1E56_02795 [Bauldia sp.]
MTVRQHRMGLSLAAILGLAVLPTALLAQTDKAPPLVGPASRAIQQAAPAQATPPAKTPVPALPIGAKSLRVLNIANQALALAYYDGMAWHDVSIPSGGTADVNCPGCGTTIALRFNNGATVETRQVALGTVAQLQWADATKRWALVTTD